MSLSDPISDMLTRIRNGIMASYDTVDIPSSRLKINIAKILKAEGFIKNYKILPDRQHGIIRVFLKYDDKGAPLISGIKRVSKPSGRVYANKDRIPIVLNGLGMSILTTPKGVMTDRQARKMGVGGEILCSVW
jgi:small subunit ribosomal protein S8